jgi:hypothetical protein
MASFDEVLQNAQQQLSPLKDLDADLDRQIAEIRNKDVTKPFTDDEKQKLAQLREHKAANLAAIEKLALINVRALDNTDELTRIAAALDQVVGRLKASAAKLAAIGVDAKKIGDALTNLSGLAGKVKGLAGAKG